jgi:hypothetical protein
MQHMNHEPQLSSWTGAEFKEWKDQRAEKVISKEVIAAKDAELAMKDVQMADKDAKIAILEARVAELEGRGSAAGYDGGDDDDGNKYNTEQGTDEEDWMAGEESFEYDEISENGLSEDDESIEDELAFEDLLANDEKVTVQQKVRDQELSFQPICLLSDVTTGSVRCTYTVEEVQPLYHAYPPDSPP